MKICLVGPGIMPIPPPGWGAVEILVWDYYQELTKLGHSVTIVNKMRSNSSESSKPRSKYIFDLVAEINSVDYDFVHIHYDCLFHIMDKLRCPKIGITSHYPYIDQPRRHKRDGYAGIFKGICRNKNHTIFALSVKDREMFLKNCTNQKNIFLILNGADSDSIKTCSEKKMGDRSIYLGKVEERKKQHLYQGIECLDFAGPCESKDFRRCKNYLGVWSREDVKTKLSEYGNLVLLSTGENGTPLVIKEALMAGISVVISSYCSNDLDTSLEFVDVVPDEKLGDIEYVRNVIEENRKRQNMTEEIRKYAEENFSWRFLVKKYSDMLESLPGKARLN
jgi:glycosyltransferase involved in cell wall biosynthesis